MKQRLVQRSWLGVAVHVLALVPLLLLPFDYVNNANPIAEVTTRSGTAALLLLLLSLACTPLNILFGWRWLLPLRKPLGLYAFCYAVLHMLIFVGLDYRFDLELIWLDVGEKRFVYAGLAALLLLTPLALTSTRAAMRRLGKRWKPLHRLVYLAAPLAVLHFVWLVKSDIREPLIYAGALALLLLVRLPPLRRVITRLRQRRHYDDSDGDGAQPSTI